MATKNTQITSLQMQLQELQPSMETERSSKNYLQQKLELLETQLKQSNSEKVNENKKRKKQKKNDFLIFLLFIF